MAMTITQEREDMRIAIQLKEEGWIAELIGNTAVDLQDKVNWCRESFGPMYSQLYPNAWAGKWFGAELPFQTGGIDSKRQVVLMFRDDKLYSMYRMMFPN